MSNLDLCPIRRHSLLSPNHIALYTDEGEITYSELNQCVEKSEAAPQIFFAEATLSKIAHFFSLLRNEKIAVPISPREPHLPKIDLSIVPHGVNTLLCTSGTMGSPKMAMHALSHHLYSATHPHPDLTLEPSDAWLLSLPFNHVGGMAILFRAFSSGAAVIIGRRHQKMATHISFVPTQLKRFLQTEEYHLYPKLKALLLGGAPIPKSLCDTAFDKNVPLYVTYGMTEASSQIATAKYDPQQGLHFGFGLEGREIKIDQERGIWIKGKTLFLGYFPRQKELQEGWFPTGDLGIVGPYGLELLGRKDRMIISGGENIHLDELEKVFLQIPEVAHVDLKARVCEEFGERPVAFVLLSSTLSLSEIRTKLEKFLPRYKIPDEKDLHIFQP